MKVFVNLLKSRFKQIKYRIKLFFFAASKTFVSAFYLHLNILLK